MDLSMARPAPTPFRPDIRRRTGKGKRNHQEETTYHDRSIEIEFLLSFQQGN